MNLRQLVRPHVRKIHAYVPGEQPKVRGLIKLNTNENPYPPSPKVLSAIRQAVDGRLRLYPNPAAQPLREKLAKLHGCAPENIIIGNGSDELLALATRGFVAQASSLHEAHTSPNQHSDDSKPSSVNSRLDTGGTPAPRSAATIQYFNPSYSLYPILADIQGAHKNPVPLNPDFSLPTINQLRRGKQWDFSAALTYITTPNAPSGRGYSTAELAKLCRATKGVVILDEAYVDFAKENALELALKHPHVLVSRTFSKAYSLCFQRIGYFIGHPEMISTLDRIRDSYNVNGLGQVGALATLGDLAYYRRNFKRIIATREKVSAQLTKLGFEVLPSSTNFIFAKPPKFPAEQWLAKLRDRKLLVRWFKYPETRNYIRVTIGTEKEMAKFVQVCGSLMKA